MQLWKTITKRAYQVRININVGVLYVHIEFLDDECDVISLSFGTKIRAVYVTLQMNTFTEDGELNLCVRANICISVVMRRSRDEFGDVRTDLERLNLQRHRWGQLVLWESRYFLQEILNSLKIKGLESLRSAACWNTFPPNGLAQICIHMSNWIFP